MRGESKNNSEVTEELTYRQAIALDDDGRAQARGGKFGSNLPSDFDGKARAQSCGFLMIE